MEAAPILTDHESDFKIFSYSIELATPTAEIVIILEKEPVEIVIVPVARFQING